MKFWYHLKIFLLKYTFKVYTVSFQYCCSIKENFYLKVYLILDTDSKTCIFENLEKI